MRQSTMLAAALLLVGCATQPASPPVASVSPPPPRATSTATGLAFDPPIAARSVTPDLSRSPREPSAANGVVESSVSNYNVTTSIQNVTNNGGFNQSTVTQEAGTVRR